MLLQGLLSSHLPAKGLRPARGLSFAALLSWNVEEEKQGELGGGRPSSLPAGGVPGLELPPPPGVWMGPFGALGPAVVLAP